MMYADCIYYAKIFFILQDAGSDVGAMSCSAVKDGDSYILNGTKSWVTSGLEGKAAIIFATIDKSLKHKG